MRKKDKIQPVVSEQAIRQLSFEDLLLFEAISRLGSMGSAARELRLRPPHVSKAVSRIENKLGTPLFERSSLGVQLNADGRDFLQFCTKVLESIAQARFTSAPDGARKVKFLTLAGPMFLMVHLAATCITRALKAEQVGLRMIELQDQELISPSMNEYFDVALHCGELNWGKSWMSFPVGNILWTLCARTDHPLAARSSEKEVLNFPFVTPSSLGTHGFRTGVDRCPVGAKGRWINAEVSTGEIGLRIALASDHLIFLPELQASQFVRQKLIKVIEVKEWLPVRENVYLTVHQDRITQQKVQTLSKAVELGLRTLS